MAKLERIAAPLTASLAEEAFAARACCDYGVAVLKGATSWQAHERGYLELPTNAGTCRVSLAYDERKAPYPTRGDGTEDRTLLLSLSDEDDYITCAWARVQADAPVVGVGVDLSAASHFDERPRKYDLSRLLFTEQELALVPQLHSDSTLAMATLFAAKEAAFKATAAPLRRWYEHHQDELLYEVRHFVMAEPGLERGTARNAAAQAAMERMGIERIVVHHRVMAGMALVVAVALGGRSDPAAQ